MYFFLISIFLSANLFSAEQTIRIEREQMALDYYLAMATHSGDLNGVQQMLGFGANPNSFHQETEDDGGTPLQIALWRGHDSIATLLINHGAKLDTPEENSISTPGPKL